MDTIINLLDQINAAVPPEVLVYAPWATSVGLGFLVCVLWRRNANLKRRLRRLDTHEGLRIRRHLTL